MADYHEYKGIKVSHSGEWDALAYHHPYNQHPESLKETSEKRAMKPVPRNRNKPNAPKPSTKTIDLATGKKTPVPIDMGINQALKNDLTQRGLK